ncbi:hypothetical protein C8F04DRAFT_1200838 [Mycena alexandri]|uniref:Uncharacterized protein n=1 Tax=Mycena alexandri TaxID=1745969 RepID=A0AAD6RXF3_9AGAR|nr:hypothetical protein C8F04DRAFT_1200838 [Mycena alexandri]
MRAKPVRAHSARRPAGGGQTAHSAASYPRRAECESGAEGDGVWWVRVEMRKETMGSLAARRGDSARTQMHPHGVRVDVLSALDSTARVCGGVREGGDDERKEGGGGRETGTGCKIKEKRELSTHLLPGRRRSRSPNRLGAEGGGVGVKAMSLERCDRRCANDPLRSGARHARALIHLRRVRLSLRRWDQGSIATALAGMRVALVHGAAVDECRRAVIPLNARKRLHKEQVEGEKAGAPRALRETAREETAREELPSRRRRTVAAVAKNGLKEKAEELGSTGLKWPGIGLDWGWTKIRSGVGLGDMRPLWAEIYLQTYFSSAIPRIPEQPVFRTRQGSLGLAKPGYRSSGPFDLTTAQFWLQLGQDLNINFTRLEPVVIRNIDDSRSIRQLNNDWNIITVAQ